MNSKAGTFFQEGGSLDATFPSYMERKADQELFEAIQQSRFCYILTARQMGKSSLCIRAKEKLGKQGFLSSYVDITSYGKENITADKWYRSVLETISYDLGLQKDVYDWWKENDHLTSVFRFFSFIKKEITKKIGQSIVIFVDEIDSLLNIDKKIFNSDDFFASIRALYNERANDKDLFKINFVIVGVASPNELMKDRDRTPFNIGTSVSLNNFTLSELYPLEKGLTHLPFDLKQLMEQVYFWTSGQPILTQQLCRALSTAEIKTTDVKDFVRTTVEDTFINNSITDANNNNLYNIQNRFTSDEKYGTRMLQHYSNILRYGNIKEDIGDISQIYLKLTGLVKKEKNNLVVTNNIYKSKLNQAWIVDINSLINRPFNGALKEWNDNSRSETKSVRGEELQKFNDWANPRNDLSVEEREFLTFSNNVQAREEAKKELLLQQKENDKKAKEKLDAETTKLETQIRKNKSLKKRYYVFFGLLGGLIILAFAGYLLSLGTNKKLQEQADKLKRESETAKDSLNLTRGKLNLTNNQVRLNEKNLSKLQEEQIKADNKLAIMAEAYSTIQAERKKIQAILTKQTVQAHASEAEAQYARLKSDSLNRIASFLQDSLYRLTALSDSLGGIVKFKLRYTWASRFDDDTELPLIKRHIDNIADPDEKNKAIHGYEIAACAIANIKEDVNFAYYKLLEAQKSTGKDPIISRYLDELPKTHLFYDEMGASVPASDYNTYLPISDKTILAYSIYNPDSFYLINAQTLKISKTFRNYDRDSTFFGYSASGRVDVCFNAKDEVIHVLRPDYYVSTYDYNGKRIRSKQLKLPRLKSGASTKVYYKSKDEIIIKTKDPAGNIELFQVKISKNDVKRENMDNLRRNIQQEFTGNKQVSQKGSLVLYDFMYLPDLKKFLFIYSTSSSNNQLFFLASENLSKNSTDLNRGLDGSYFLATELWPYTKWLLLESSTNSRQMLCLYFDGTVKKINIPDDIRDNLSVYASAIQDNFIVFQNFSNKSVIYNTDLGTQKIIVLPRESSAIFIANKLVSFDSDDNVYGWHYSSSNPTQQEIIKKNIEPFSFKNEKRCN